MEMRSKNGPLTLVFLCFLFAFWLSSCQKGSAPTGTPNAQTTEKKRLSPERVDIRGSIIRSSYNQGQVMLEVEGTSSQNSRYQRAYVLVLPTTQIVGREGRQSA
jgi:hypothetical protein